jgi:hypothetical protein
MVKYYKKNKGIVLVDIKINHKQEQISSIISRNYEKPIIKDFRINKK